MAKLPVLQENGCARVCCAGFEMDVSPEQLMHKGRTADETKMLAWFSFKHRTDTGWAYECSRWDSKTGNCSDYSNRPEVCRAFPGKDGCDFDGCGIGPTKK